MCDHITNTWKSLDTYILYKLFKKQGDSSLLLLFYKIFGCFETIQVRALVLILDFIKIELCPIKLILKKKKLHGTRVPCLQQCLGRPIVAFSCNFFYKFDIYQAQGALQQCFKTLQWRFICLLWRFHAIFFIRFREPYSDILKAYNDVLKVYSGVLELEFYANLIFFFFFFLKFDQA